MISNPNTIYEIRYDFDLNDATVDIPEGCILKFEGGSLGNGKLIGDNTSIESAIVCIFRSMGFGGTFNIPVAYSEWFGAKGNGENDDTSAINSSITLSKTVKLLSGKNYKVTSSILLRSNTSLIGEFNTKISSEGIFEIIKIGYRSTVRDLIFELQTPSCVISISSEYLAQTYDEDHQESDAYRYRTSVGINLSNISVFCPYNEDLVGSETQNCIQSIANGKGTGFWQIIAKNINICGQYRYGIYLDNSIEIDGNTTTWQTDQSWEDIKIIYCKNGIYIGKNDKDGKVTGFPPERITFTRVSMQCVKDLSERFAYIDSGNRIVFNCCEPWDWNNTSYKPYLVNVNKSKGVTVDKSSVLGTGSQIELTTGGDDKIDINANIPNEVNIGNSSVKATYDLSFFIDEERLNTQSKLKVEEIRKLLPGNYIVSGNSKYDALFGIGTTSHLTLSYGGVMSVEKLRNNAILLELRPFLDKEVLRYFTHGYLIIYSSSDGAEDIPSFVEMQTRISTFDNVSEFVDIPRYKYNEIGFVKSDRTSQRYRLAFKKEDQLIFDALGYKYNERYGTTAQRPTDLTPFDSGFLFFDTDVMKPIFWNGSKFITGDGNDPETQTWATIE